MSDSNSQYLNAAFPLDSRPKNSGLQICDITNPIFDMNIMLSAAQNYNALNLAVNKLIGMEVRWFRAIPQQRSQDVIFQEYTLSCVSDTPLCLKVILPDGNFPDSKYNYDLMGLEYEVPLEIHIDKTYWESFAGQGTAPQKKDIVYFSVPNKLYQVVSSYLLRGFMEQETTWKINLAKYMPESSRREGEILQQTIEQYTVSEAEIFGEKLESDIKKLTNDKQMSPFNSTALDKYKILDDKLLIVPNKLEIYGTIVAQSFYDLGTSKYFNAVVYKGIDEIQSTSDRCITAWTMIDPGVVSTFEVNSIKADNSMPYPANYILNVKTRSKGFQIGATIEISRPGSLNFYATIINDTDAKEGNYNIHIDNAVVNYLNSIKSNWTSATGYKMVVQNPVSILDGMHNSGTGFKVDIYANQFIKINYGTQEHIAILKDKLLNKEWYGIIVNIGNTWGQYNTYVYKQSPSDSKEKLENIFYETIDFIPEQTTVDYYSINNSPSLLTNLRLYVSTMEEEKQRDELLSYFVKDGDQLILGDSAEPRHKPPYIGSQR